MNAYEWADLLLQHALNALFAYILYCLLTQGFIYSFRIQNNRLKALLKAIPPLRALLHPLFSLLPLQLFPFNLSIFSCSYPLQQTLFNHLSDASKEELLTYNLKTLSGKGWLLLPEQLVYLIICSAFIFTWVRIFILFRNFTYTNTLLRKLKKNAKLLELSRLKNPSLIDELKRGNVNIFISNEIEEAFTGFDQSILIPKVFIEDLSRNELNAVIAHELEHLRFYDSIIKLLCKLSASIFWWIPMHKRLNAIEITQELACDAAVNNFSIDGKTLAQALFKALKMKFTPRSALLSAFAAGKNSLLLRVESILNPSFARNQRVGPEKIKWIVISVLTTTPLIQFVTC